MTERQSKSQPTWSDVKAKLTSLDQAGLLNLIRDLYAAHKENQMFLHARLGLCEDVLKLYKQRIDRWLWPDVYCNHLPSVAKAKQAISDYKKAVGASAGLAELMVYYCELAAGFCVEFGTNDEDSYRTALLNMFEQALAITDTLPADARDALFARMDHVRDLSQKIGYGAGEHMDFLRAHYE
jgi:hypothetical protein